MAMTTGAMILACVVANMDPSVVGNAALKLQQHQPPAQEYFMEVDKNLLACGMSAEGLQSMRSDVTPYVAVAQSIFKLFCENSPDKYVCDVGKQAQK